MVLCVRVLAPTEGLGGATLVDGVLPMVLEPTLAVAHTGQCANIGCMARVGLRWDVQSCAKREGSWTSARVSVRTYACACGPGMGHTAWRMGRHWTGELDRRGRRVL
jgi:hypothetical protein